LVTKATAYRFDDEILKRISAWALILNTDKTSVLKQAFVTWEQSRSEEEKRKIEIILDQLK